jgi:hypothetical protein
MEKKEIAERILPLRDFHFATAVKIRDPVGSFLFAADRY